MADRETIIKKCQECIDSGEPAMDYSFYYRVIELLKEQQKQQFFVDSDGKITPLPIQKHGHWIKLPKFLLETQCSVCKETYVGDYRGFNFCPECGARMDEEVKQNETD